MRPLFEAYVEDEDDGAPLADVLESHWDLFTSRALHGRRDFIGAVAGLLSSTVGAETSVRLKVGDGEAGRIWSAFVDEISGDRRWFFIESDATRLIRLLDLCLATRAEAALDSMHEFVRARVGSFEDEAGLGAPPPGMAAPGRANPPGVSMFYCATAEKIAVHEVRPSRQAVVSTARFRAASSLRLADFTQQANRKPSPFFSDENGDLVDPSEIYVANELGSIVGDALSRPVRESDNKTEYLATQYVAEYVRHFGLDGIRYRSSFEDRKAGVEGDNLVVFTPSAMAMVAHSSTRLEIKGVAVTY
ncbi:RES family NAD+ phosphorylase [Demequina iriomotensis]|uniref:RES family NAD+ phosphorylase n=1 Tax=Demequina iriomotensis TaxID=1536641 RepID=UPI0012E0B3EB|nr:RES family NAD+ phosphorylase [Demequina iriomotensis]